MKVTRDISGTLGLWSLIGRITVIDYPGRRVCLFADTDLPRGFLLEPLSAQHYAVASSSCLFSLEALRAITSCSIPDLANPR
jgi:hypothetical protein